MQPDHGGGCDGRPGRRARANATRTAFQVARNRGLVLRHRHKLAHLAERTGGGDGARHTCSYCHHEVLLADLLDHLESCRHTPTQGGQP